MGKSQTSVQTSVQTEESKTFQFEFSDVEQLLQGVNLDILRTQIDQINQQITFQRQAFATAQPAMAALQRDARSGIDAFTDEERSAQLRAQQERSERFGAAQDELLEGQLDLIRRGSGATDEQRQLINEATEAQIARGESDILDFGREAVGVITQEIAPSRGLRPSDAPIQDRAFQVGGELARQQGQLVTGLRGAQAQAELNFPLAANAQQAAFGQFQQQLGQGAMNFQQQLRQQSIANRLNLFGQSGQLGLGLIGGIQPQANLQQAFRPQLGTEARGENRFESESFAPPGIFGF